MIQCDRERNHFPTMLYECIGKLRPSRVDTVPALTHVPVDRKCTHGPHAETTAFVALVNDQCTEQKVRHNTVQN